MGKNQERNVRKKEGTRIREKGKVKTQVQGQGKIKEKDSCKESLRVSYFF